MKSVRDEMFAFWATAFGLSDAQLRTPIAEIVSTGRYLERQGDQYIYFFTDLSSGKNIFAASVANQAKYTPGLTQAELQALNVESVRQRPLLNVLKLEFRDIDYCFAPGAAMPLPSAPIERVRPLSLADEKAVDQFYLTCTQDEADTLDLRLAEDFALGLFDPQQNLVGVARYSSIPKAKYLVDITVLVGSHHRGKHYATALVTRLLQNISSRSLLPRYRVQEDNWASRAIAERLGMKPTHRLLAWRTTA